MHTERSSSQRRQQKIAEQKKSANQTFSSTHVAAQFPFHLQAFPTTFQAQSIKLGVSLKMVVRFELENVGRAEASRFWFDGGAFFFYYIAGSMRRGAGPTAAQQGFHVRAAATAAACSEQHQQQQQAAAAAAAATSSNSNSTDDACARAHTCC